MTLTNGEDLAKRMQLLRSHGITREIADMTRQPDGPWYYQQTDLGFNYRMTDMQAALGLSQMKRLYEFVARRHVIADRYDKMLAELPIVIPWQYRDSYSGRHLYVIRLQLDKIRKGHRQVFELMREAGIGVNLHYIPVYLQPYYERLGFKSGYCPQAEAYYGEAISLPIYTALTETQLDQVVTSLRNSITA